MNISAGLFNKSVSGMGLMSSFIVSPSVNSSRNVHIIRLIVSVVFIFHCFERLSIYSLSDSLNLIDVSLVRPDIYSPSWLYIFISGTRSLCLSTVCIYPFLYAFFRFWMAIITPHLFLLTIAYFNIRFSIGIVFLLPLM